MLRNVRTHSAMQCRNNNKDLVPGWNVPEVNPEMLSKTVTFLGEDLQEEEFNYFDPPDTTLGQADETVSSGVNQDSIHESRPKSQVRFTETETSYNGMEKYMRKGSSVKEEDEKYDYSNPPPFRPYPHAILSCPNTPGWLEGYPFDSQRTITAHHRKSQTCEPNVAGSTWKNLYDLPTNPLDPYVIPGRTGQELTEGLQINDVHNCIHDDLPDRFHQPELFKGYGCEKAQHVYYTTTSSDYGRFPPNVHTMAHTYKPIQGTFTTHLGQCGMPKDRSLNIY